MATGTDRDLTEEIELDLPEGVTFEDLERGEKAAGGMRRLRPGDAEPTRDGDGAREPEHDERDRGRGGLGAAGREERTKRKRLADKLRVVEDERDRLAAARSGGSRMPSSRVRATSPAELEARRAALRADTNVAETEQRLIALRADADKADTMGEVAVRVFKELRKDMGEQAVRVFNESRNDLLSLDEDLVNRVDFKSVRLAETMFRRMTSDYTEKLQAAGVFAALQIDPATKTFVDPAMAARVYAAENPAEESYELAEAILDKAGKLDSRGRLVTPKAADDERGRERGRDRETPRERARDEDRDGARNGSRERFRPDERAADNEEYDDEPTAGRDERSEAEDRRRDERRPDRDRDDRGAGQRDRGRGDTEFDRLPDTPTPFRGIRRLTDAGSGRGAKITREYLDELMERNPALYLQLAPDGSRIQAWHMQEERV